MVSNNLLTPGLAILLVMGSALLFTYKKELFGIQADLRECTRRIISCQKGNDETYRALNNLMTMQWQLEKDSLKNGLMLYSINQKKVSFDSLLKRANSQSILYFSWQTCEDCQIQEIRYFDKYAIPGRSFIIAAFKDFRSFKLYMEANNVHTPVYYLHDTVSLFSNFKERKVITFQADSTHSISLVHLGSSSFPELSASYFKSL